MEEGKGATCDHAWGIATPGIIACNMIVNVMVLG